MKKYILFINLTNHTWYFMGQKKFTFWVDKHIGFEQLGGNSAAITAIASLLEDPRFNLQPVLDNFYNTFTKDYAKQFPFELMDEKMLLKLRPIKIMKPVGEKETIRTEACYFKDI